MSIIRTLQDGKSIKHVQCTNNFSDGLLHILRQASKKIDSVDIYGQTSSTYYHTMKDCDFVIQTLRLLLSKPKTSREKKIPLNLEARERYFNNIETTIAYWQGLQRKGKIVNLEIRFFEHDATFHFCIVNGRYSHFGFFKAEKDIPGYGLIQSYYTVAKNSGIGGLILKDLKEYYKSVYEHASYEYGSEKED